MHKPRIFTVVPVLSPHNSICIQAQLLNQILSDFTGLETCVILSSHASTADQQDVLIYHYGSYDPWSFSLARRPRTIFVYHNVTPASRLLPWAPAVAGRAVLSQLQLRMFPKMLPWLAASEFSHRELIGYGYRTVRTLPCIVPRQTPAAKCILPTLLFVGRISPNKNVIALLRIYRMVANSYGGTVRLTIVGTRKPRCLYGCAFESELRWTQAQYPVSWYSEPVSYSELQGLYRSSWLYVSASLHEGFGVPVLEAVAAGTPALYMTCGGTESVLQGEGCVLCGRPEFFASLIGKHLENSDERERLAGAQARQLDLLQPRNVGRQAIALLRELIGLDLDEQCHPMGGDPAAHFNVKAGGG